MTEPRSQDGHEVVAENRTHVALRTNTQREINENVQERLCAIAQMLMDSGICTHADLWQARIRLRAMNDQARAAMREENGP